MIKASLLRAAVLIGASLALLAAVPASAQDDDGRGWIVRLGGGAQAYPKYPGAEDYGIYPLPIFGLRREGQPMPFQAPDDGFGFGLLGRDSAFNIGPSVRFQSKREQDDVGAPVGDVGFTIEAGGFVEVYPVENFRLRGELRQAINGHDGLVGEVGADIVLRDEDSYIFSIGPRARYGDNNFHDSYFGVPAGTGVAGFTPYNPSSGFYAIGAVAGYTQRLGRNWGLYGYAGYDRLISDAADSPIVRVTGSRSQFSGGLGLFFEFNVGG